MLAIDKAVPLPSTLQTRNKYPWKDMEVGDSFLCPLKFEHARISAYNASTRYNRTFRAHPTPEGPRVWRVQ